MVGIGVEVEILISIQLKSNIILVAITLNLSATLKDVRIDVRVKVIEAMWLCNVGNINYKYEDIILIKKGDDVESKFYWNWNFIKMLSKLNFPHQNWFIKFPLPKTLLPKIDFYY